MGLDGTYSSETNTSSEDRRPSQDVRRVDEGKPEAQATRISLLGAIEQAAALTAHQASIALRLDSLDEQSSLARSADLLAAIEHEKQALHATSAAVQQRLHKMAELVKTISIVINGETVTATKCLEQLAVMKNQRDQLKQFLSGFNLQTFSVYELDEARAELMRSFTQAIDAWSTKIAEVAILLDGVFIEDTPDGLFTSVWLTKQAVIDLIWNSSLQSFELTDVEAGPDIQALAAEAAKYFATAPDRTVLRVRATQGIGGKVKLETQIRPPTDSQYESEEHDGASD